MLPTTVQAAVATTHRNVRTASASPVRGSTRHHPTVTVTTTVPVKERCDADAHLVYATAASASLGDGVEAGDRIVLVYPMMEDKESGIVSMRLKRIHSRTGQLSYTWVPVYDANTDVRHVTDFSLIP